MKYLYLLRHGKAELATALQSDHDRNLIYRGRCETRKTSRRFAKQEWKRPMIFCSSANRALQTAQIFMHVTGQADDMLRVEKAIYQADADDLVSLLREMGGAFEAIMVVGHNPALSELVGLLVPHGGEHIPTGGLVCIKLAVDSWKEISRGRGESGGTIFPKIKTVDRRMEQHMELLVENLGQAMESTLDHLSYPPTAKRRFLIDRASEKLAKKLLKE